MTEYMPEAEVDEPRWTTRAMARNTSSVRVVMHWTATPVHVPPRAVADMMYREKGGATGYHLLVPMIVDHRPLQLRPASVAAGSLLNDGDTLRISPNRQGTLLFQVSMCCTTGDDPFVKGPGPWWPDVLDYIRSLGVPDRFVSGNWTPSGLMSTEQWYSPASGWTAHKQVPETQRVRKVDPGPVDETVLWGTTPPRPPQPPAQAKIVLDTGGVVTVRQLSQGMVGRDVREMQVLLTDWGFPLVNDGQFGPRTADALRRFQSVRGLAVDGICGSMSWTSLLGG